MPLLEGDVEGWPERTLYLQSHRGDEPQLYRAFAAISQRYKLTQPLAFSQAPPADAPFELYDLEADSSEEHDVAAEHPDVVAHMKQEYEAWFRDVSATHGYGGVPILLGTVHENPVWLTRQDWRSIGEDNWAKGGLGAWDVDVRSAGTYEIRIHFREAAERAGRVELALGGATQSADFKTSDESVLFDNVELAAGIGRLEASVLSGDEVEGAWFAEVRKR
jgi:arylsulfatase/arylsulfatase A